MIPGLIGRLDRPAEVVWDQINNRWDTGRRSLLAFDPDASHHMVIQDDTIPCRDLVAGVERSLEWVPEGSPVMCYVGRVRPYRDAINQNLAAAGNDPSWLTFGETFWGPCLVIPTGVIPELVERCDRMRVANYDRRIGLWFRSKRIPVYAPWPSLVEHRDSPSTQPERTAVRHAHRFIGADQSALTVDWSGPVFHVPVGTRAV
jgi:hypothetical protein